MYLQIFTGRSNAPTVSRITFGAVPESGRDEKPEDKVSTFQECESLPAYSPPPRAPHAENQKFLIFMQCFICRITNSALAPPGIHLLCHFFVGDGSEYGV